MVASLAPGARRRSSSSPARRSAIIRSAGALPESRGRVALRRQARRAALLGEQVDGQRGVAVGGEARRDRADVRRQPAVLVDHQHRTTGRSASATSPISSPFGPAKRISSPVAEADAADSTAADVDGDPDVGGRSAALVAGAFDAARAGRRGGVAVVAACREQHAGRRGAHPQQPEAAQRFPTGEQALLAVEGDLLNDVVLECHRKTLRGRRPEVSAGDKIATCRPRQEPLRDGFVVPGCASRKRPPGHVRRRRR